MIIDFNDPTSIVAWWNVFPERHGGILEHLLRTEPQYRGPIREAQRRIVADPVMAQKLAAVRARRHVQPVEPQAADYRELAEAY